MKSFLVLSIIALLLPQLYAQSNRVALIIGNSKYENGAPLANPVNDAEDIEALLTASGFEVMKFTDLDQVGMKKAIDDFGTKLRNADVGLFFYAGHGIQSQGENYLVPVDAALKTENDVEYNCVNGGRILAKMEDAGTRTNIIILDACRDNPFERSWSRSSTGQGLAVMNAPHGSIIAYSTAPGKTASDGYKRNSPYTAALLKYMQVPNVKIEDFFKLVRVSVRENTSGQQTPWESTSLEGDFYFTMDKDLEKEMISVNKILAETEGIAANRINEYAAPENRTSFEEERKRLASSIRSLAILPFSNYTGDESQEYIAAGIHDALIGELGQIGELRVISKTSTLRYKGFDKTLKEVADELNVDGVVESALIGTDDGINIQMKLFTAKPYEQLIWSHTFSSELTNIFDLYNNVIKDITASIQVSLSPEKQQDLETSRPVDPEAYKAYLQGRFHWGMLTQEGIQSALMYYAKAVEIDPDYAPAYGATAGVWAVLKQMDFVSADDAKPHIETNMAKALALDDKNHEVCFYTAVIKVWTDFDWEGGEEYFLKCLAINPNYSDAWAYYSHLLMILKRFDEMEEAMNKALSIDPTNLLIRPLQGTEFAMTGKHKEAIDAMVPLQRLMPTNQLIAGILAQCYYLTEQYDHSIKQIELLLEHHEHDTILSTLRSVYAESGYKAAMSATAEVIEEFAEFVAPQHMYLFYFLGGNIEKSLYWVERAYIRNDPGNPYLGSQPVLKELYSEPRYIEILERMNLPY